MIGNNIKNMTNKLVDRLAGVAKTTVDAGSQIIDGAPELIDGALDTAKNFINEEVLDTSKKVISSGYDTVKAYGGAAVDGIKTVKDDSSEIVEDIKNGVEEAYTYTKEKVSGAYESVKSTSSELVDTVKSSVSKSTQPGTVETTTTPETTDEEKLEILEKAAKQLRDKLSKTEPEPEPKSEPEEERPGLQEEV